MRKIRLPKAPKSDFWHLHAHSKFSAGDALPSVEQMVDTVASLNQPAMALTDHGNMAGSVQLYQEAKKHGITPFPGEEFYVKRAVLDKKAKRYHVGIVAFTTEGYESLVKLSSKSHTRPNFDHKPQIDFSDMAEWYERGWTQGLALTTGCYFGMVQQALVQGNKDDAEYMIRTFATWFPHTYVELQNHHIDHEDGYTDAELTEELAEIAYDLGLPVVITQDAHYCTVDDKPQHETLKRLVSWGEDGDDAVFPGDGFHLADDRFMREHYNGVGQWGLWERGIEGLTDLRNKHSLVIPELETYHYNVPVVTAGDPFVELHSEVMSWLSDLDHDGVIRRPGQYRERLKEELEVVDATDMAGYLMLNKMICDWMKEQGIFFQTRGSASGSLICFLLGITQEDPIVEGLRYERFLSKDRTKPPDIDLDVEDTRRGEVLEMLDQHFNVCQIGTWAKFGLDDEGGGGGSLFVAYIARQRKDGVDPSVLGTIKKMHDVPRDDRKELERLAWHHPYKSYGTHAGGVVVSTDRAQFDRLVPTMLVASSETTVTQFDMDDVEALGMLKEDILGQISLTTLRRCHELLGRDVVDGWNWIPLDDKETYRAIRQQKVDGVFQLEGWTNKKGCREMRPKKLRDVIHLVSLYRPATMETGMKDTYIQRMAGWEKVPERHPILMKHLKETYGVPVFQDQVIAVLRDLGFSPEELTEFLKAVKASNENIGGAAKVVAKYREVFFRLATETGWTDDDMRFTWEAIEGFAKYGFNKAHATTYGKRAYRMAYLRTHYPLEFFAALLQTWAGKKKERDYIIAAKEAGIRMLGPDVNVSGALWSIDHQRQAIRKGLLSIKGIGDKAANEIERHAPFQDMDDLIARCDAKAVNGGKNWSKDGTLNGALGKLQEAKALRSLGL